MSIPAVNFALMLIRPIDISHSKEVSVSGVSKSHAASSAADPLQCRRDPAAL